MTPALSEISARWLRRFEAHAIWLVLVALFVLAALLSEAFLRPVYLFNIVRQIAPVGIAAIGVTFVMVLGGVDLSVGAVISLAAVVSAVLMDGQVANIPYAITLTLLVGAAVGLTNGLLIAFNRVSPFVLTLGMAIAVYGINQIYSGGTARGVVAPGYREFFNFRIGGIVPVLATTRRKLFRSASHWRRRKIRARGPTRTACGSTSSRWSVDGSMPIFWCCTGTRFGTVASTARGSWWTFRSWRVG